MSGEAGQAQDGKSRNTTRSLMLRRILLASFVFLLLVALAAAGLFRYANSAEFRERAREFVRARIERASGGQVELRAVSWELRHLHVVLEGLTVHGREAAGEAPLLSTERVEARIKLTPLLHGGLRFHDFEVVRPQVHFKVYPDGTTNLPEPLPSDAKTEAHVQRLFRFAADRVRLEDGTILWNQQRIKATGQADAVAVELDYRRSDHSYGGVLEVGNLRVEAPQVKPLTMAAESAFRLYRDHLDIARLRVTTQHSWAETGGTLEGFSSPVIQFSYKASGDLAELGQLAHNAGLRSGTLTAVGEGVYRAAGNDYTLVGNAQAQDVSWSGDAMNLSHISGGAMFSLNRNGLRAPSLFATVLGGTVHGSLDVQRASKPTGHAQLEIVGVELKQALRAINPSGMPLDRLRLGGLTAGTLNANWTGSPENARVEMNLRVTPVARGGELPVTATGEATVALHERTIWLHGMEASTPSTHLTAHGILAANSNLNLDLATTNLAELAPLVDALRGPRAAALPLEFAGRARFRGVVSGRMGESAGAGHLELHDFTSVFLLHRDQPTERTVRMRWDLLEGDIEYSPARESLRNGVLQRAGARAAVDVSVALRDGRYDPAQPFSAHVKLENAEVRELQGLFGSSYPVSGQVSGDVHVSGTEDHLSGSGNVQLRNGSAWGQAVRSGVAEVNFTENQAQLRGILIRSDLMQLAGDAKINLDTSEFGFALKGTDIKIENLQAVRAGKIPATGLASFEASGSGTPSAPVINGRLWAHNLAVGRQRIGDINVEAVTHGAEMTLAARSNFKAAEVKLDGQVHLRGDMPMHISGDMQSANLSALLGAVFPMRHGITSEGKLHLEATGAARRPQEISVDVEIQRWATNYAGFTVSNDGPIRLKIENQILQVEQFRLAGEQGTRFLQVRGQVHLSGQREMDLHAEGSVNLKLLETIDPSLMADGVANLDVHVNGVLAHPAMRGRMNAEHATVSSIDFPNGLSDITGTMVFNEDRLQIQEVTARTGGGLLHCAGFVAFGQPQGPAFNLTASGREIRLRYPEGLSSTADATFTLTGSLHNALLSGQVTITRLGLNPQFDFAAYLMRSARGAPAQKIDFPLNGVHLDVHITSTPELQVQTALARLSGNVDLRLRGTASRPIVLGRVNLLEGTISFSGTKYRLERGDVTFINPVRIDPAVDMELSARVRDYDIALGLHGPLERLTTTYRSDPPLSSSDIISLLALGRTTEESANPAMIGTAQYQPAVSESASNALLGQALNATVNSRVQKLFGVSRLKIDPNAGSELNAGLARVTVEQQISNKLTLTYITNLNQSAQQIIQFEYNLNRGVTIVGTRDQMGVVSFDVVLRKRRK